MDSAPFGLTFGVELEFIVRYDPEKYQDQLVAAGERNLWHKDHQYGILVRQDMIQTLNNNGFPTNSYRLADISKWTVATDHTVTAIDGSENWYAIELKSPVLYYCCRALELVERVVELLVSNFDLHVNKTCGLHVHVGDGIRGFALPTLKKFASLITVFEHQLDSLHPPNRLQNHYAKPVCRTFRNDATPREKLSIIGRLETVDDLVRRFHTVDDPTPNEESLSFAQWESRVDDAICDRYMAFNFFNLRDGERFQTIEFRQHQGTLDPNVITNWIRTTCSLVDLSHTDKGDLGDLIKNHIDDTDYTVIDLFKDLSLSDLAEFYASLV